MGRRKIEIKAIKDDRNRSVTFLKRKGGLFKKAHELSVLCSVDVAVIIFGSNKKLYEFSSGDIHQTLQRYYHTTPHEHKGPGDFADKDGGDDDDDEDIAMGTPPQEFPSPPNHGVPQHAIHDQPHMQHMRNRSTPSASVSPPMPNGAFPHRLSTPQPQHPGSRPSSRTTHVRRQSSNLVPQNHPHPQATQPMQQHPQQHPQYMYQQQPQYNQQHAQQQAQQHAAYMRASQGTPPMHTPPMPQHHYTHPGPPQTQMQQLYLQEHRRQSMPPQIPVHTQQEAIQHQPIIHTPPQPSRPFQSPPLPGPEPQHLPLQQHAPVPRRAFGVIPGPNSQEPQQRAWQPPVAEMSGRPPIKEEDIGPRPSSIDVAAAMRHDDNHSRYGATPATAPLARTSQGHSGSVSSMPAPSRVNSMASNRPKLSVQIPGEATESGAEEGAGDSSKEASVKTNSTPAKPATSETSHHSNLVLPAPSPRSASAGAILSAGATGPSNPFARPTVPKKQEAAGDHFKDASPMSALPSRVMQEHGYMSSPSSMFPELGFGSMHGNTLASPAVYQPTPIAYHGPSFRDEPSDKRKKSPGDEEGGATKKPKSG